MRVGHVKQDRGIYIGRSCGQYKGSVLGNPFHIGKDGTRDQVVAKYRAWLWQQMQGQGPVMAELNRLAEMPEDTVLLCWCAPQACHGDIVVKAVDWLKQQEF